MYIYVDGTRKEETRDTLSGTFARCFTANNRLRIRPRGRELCYWGSAVVAKRRYEVGEGESAADFIIQSGLFIIQMSRY